jgi:hypothetical protein
MAYTKVITPAYGGFGQPDNTEASRIYKQPTFTCDLEITVGESEYIAITPPIKCSFLRDVSAFITNDTGHDFVGTLLRLGTDIANGEIDITKAYVDCTVGDESNLVFYALASMSATNVADGKTSHFRTEGYKLQGYFQLLAYYSTNTCDGTITTQLEGRYDN